jgi:MFS family permease
LGVNKIKNNPPLQTIVAWAIITALAVFGIFAPSLFGMDGFKGGYAISFVSFFMVICGIIVIAIYSGRARAVSRILKADNVLAHWTYDPAEWNEYAEKQYVEEKKEKRVLFYIISAFALFFGILFFLIDNESGLWVLLLMLALIAVIAFTAWFTAWYNHRQNIKYLGETYITADSVYINRQLHTWRGLGAKLESVDLDKHKAHATLTLVYSAPTRTGLQDYTVRIPVPRGKEAEAEQISQKLQQNS